MPFHLLRSDVMLLLTCMLSSSGVVFGQTADSSGKSAAANVAQNSPYVVLLGVAQDAGYPQAGCQKACCLRAWQDSTQRRHVVSLGIVDPQSGQRWLIDCTPDFREQLQRFNALTKPAKAMPALDGLFLTHAHIGHYTGLVHLGREVMGARETQVFAMPRMRTFLEQNGPWDQLVSLKNVVLRELAPGRTQPLNQRLQMTPILVPHRDEYSETVAYLVAGPGQSVLYLPDIDKWDRWSTKIEEIIKQVDVAYVDGTFFDERELPGRDMSEIPHPFVVESMQRFERLPASERAKVRFLHFNHTNPLLDPASPAARNVRDAGFRIAVEGEVVSLQ